MKNVINKPKYLSLKKTVYYSGVALITLMCASSVSRSMDFTEKELLDSVVTRY